MAGDSEWTRAEVRAANNIDVLPISIQKGELTQTRLLFTSQTTINAPLATHLLPDCQASPPLDP